MFLYHNITERGRGRPSKPILGEGTRVHVHMSHYDRRGPGQSLKTHPGWRYSSACPYVPIWLKGTGAKPILSLKTHPGWRYSSACPYVPIWRKGTGAVPQNPSWVKVLECMSICPNMTEGDRGSEGTSKPIPWVKVYRRRPGQSLKTCPYVPIWLKGTGAVPQNPSWVKAVPQNPSLGEGTRVQVHMSHYDRRGPGQSLKTHPGWRYSSAGPYVPLWPKGTGAVPQNPSWVKVLECMSICPNMTEGDRGRPSKPILGEGTRVQVHMSHYDRRGPGQSLKTHPGWRYSSACPYVPLWPIRGPGQSLKTHPGWSYSCRSICHIMTEGGPGQSLKTLPGCPRSICPIMTQRGPPRCKALKTHLGWRYSSAVSICPIWPKGTQALKTHPGWLECRSIGRKGTGAVPQNPSWVKVLECMSICPNMTEGDRGRSLKTHLGWRYSSACPYVPIWLKGTGAGPQNPSWVKALECSSICLNMSQGGQQGGCIPFEGEAYTIPSK